MSQVAVVVKLKVLDGQRDAMTEAVKSGIETAKGSKARVSTCFITMLSSQIRFGSTSFMQIKMQQMRT